MVEPDRTDPVLRPMGLHPAAIWAGYLGLLPFVAALLCAVFGHGPLWWQVSERLALGRGDSRLRIGSALGAGFGWKMAVDCQYRPRQHFALGACRRCGVDRRGSWLGVARRWLRFVLVV